MLASCAPKPKVQEGPVLKADRLIDAHRTDEAIIFMEAQVRAHPENPEYVVTLASAYASKAGVRVQRLMKTIDTAKKYKPQLKKAESLPAMPEKSKKTDLWINQALGLLINYESYMRVYESVPVIDQEHVVYLNQAISLLDGLGSKPRPSDALYRAILRILLVKSQLNELFSASSGIIVQTDTSCAINTQKINDRMTEIGQNLIYVYQDLGVAQPDKAKKYKNEIDQITNAVTNLTTLNDSAIILSDAIKTVFNQTLLQSGLGTQLKCGGKELPSF